MFPLSPPFAESERLISKESTGQSHTRLRKRVSVAAGKPDAYLSAITFPCFFKFWKFYRKTFRNAFADLAFTNGSWQSELAGVWLFSRLALAEEN